MEEGNEQTESDSDQELVIASARAPRLFVTLASSIVVPAIIAGAGHAAGRRFLEFLRLGYPTGVVGDNLWRHHALRTPVAAEVVLPTATPETTAEAVSGDAPLWTVTIRRGSPSACVGMRS